MSKEIIQTNSAPKAIGTYSQGVKIDTTVYLSGQIPIDPASMTMVEGEISVHIRRVFDNLKSVTAAAGGNLSDIVKLNVFLVDISHFPVVNEIMGEYFEPPYPARAVVQVAALPKGALIEMDGIMEINLEYSC
jgi:reactive intermediate/imine deaminase